MRTFITSCLVALPAGLPAGCQLAYTQPTTQPARLSAAERDFEAVWQASRQTLQGYHFELDRQDRRAGVITTAPLTGMHFFELWRKDAVRPADFGESTVQTIYRTARVTVRPIQADAQTYQARVEVSLHRSDKPAPQVTSTSDAYSLFSLRGGRKGRPQPLLEATAGGGPRVDLGQDRALEAKLASDIAAAADRLRGVAPAAPKAAGAPRKPAQPGSAEKSAPKERPEK